MRIVNIILTSQNGGAEQVFFDYISVLKSLNHQVLAITKEDAPYAKDVLDLGVEVKKIKNSFGDHDFLAVKKIKQILNDFKADAVIAHIGRSMVLTRKAIKQIKDKKIFLVAVNHSMNVKRSIGADLVFSVNKEIFYRTFELRQPHDKTFVISNAIDISDSIEEVDELDLARKSKITIGAMSRLDDKKGVDYLVRAIEKLRNFDQKITLKIAGEGFFKKDLENLVNDLKINDRVEFCGWIKDKKAFFKSIDIFCLTSTEETFGLVLLEAMKYRKPIIATSTHGAKEVIRDEIDGLLIDLNPRNSLDKNIAKAIKKMVENKELQNSLVENSYIRLKENFSYDSLKKNMKEILGEG